MGYRIGVDTGGTFTDVALVDESTGRIAVAKTPSTPENPSRAVIDGVIHIMELEGLSPEDVAFFVHGTTVATNALLELKGAKTALITTAGFRDVLHIGRQTRPSLYDFYAHRPAPVIPRRLRYEAQERMLFNGEVATPLDENSIRETAREMKANGVEAVAVCLLHSYANASHERRIKEILLEEYPEIFVTLSADILPEFREYERMSTVCINGYVMPKVNRYVADLSAKLSEMGVKSALYIMQSNGGIITAETARESSARTVLSGPAGGALAGTFVCQQTGRGEIITMDMGGTSLDICLIANNTPKYTTESYIGGYPIKLPMIDIHTIGSGGGSIAWIDAGNALRVGPQSAGAEPGPVCYQKGGTEPTVTDANVVLGRLNPEYLLNGGFRINVGKAREAIEEKIAKPLNLTVLEAALGIIKIVNANMMRGIRVVSVEKGYDPREFALVPFGGAGPVHGVELGEELGVREVIVPKYPGVTSAIGMLTADVRQDYVQTYVTDTREADAGAIQRVFEGLEAQARRDLAAEGFAGKDMALSRSADVRYRGQAYEISVPVSDGAIGADEIAQTEKLFHSEHFKSYGYNREKEVVEIVNVRLIALGKLPKVRLVKEAAAAADSHSSGGGSDNGGDNGSSDGLAGSSSSDGLAPLAKDEPTPAGFRDVYMRDGFVMTAVYGRGSFAPGAVIRGPAVVEQLDSTTLIFPGQTATVDYFGNIIIPLAGGNGGGDGDSPLPGGNGGLE